jgi:hypothetical protein
MKNPEIGADLARHAAHLDTHFAERTDAAA